MLKIIKKNALQKKVILVGPKEDVRPYLIHSLFVVLVSYWEGLSRVLIESAAMGVPILASHNGGNKEVVFDQHNGLLVDAGDVQQITMSLDRITKVKCLKEYSLNSRCLAEELFDIRKSIGKIESLYRKL